MKRLLRWLVNGLCLLSLLACVGAGWLWCRGKHAAGLAWVEVAALRADLKFISDATGFAVESIGRWPGAAGVWSGAGYDSPDRVTIPASPSWRDVNVGPIDLRSAECKAQLRPDGVPERMSFNRWRSVMAGVGPRPRWSGPLPFRGAYGIPHWLGLTLLALPPLLWLATHLRRLIVRRRRRRLGLCLRCGYDLTGNTSGTCSECGEKIEAAPVELRVTA
jgi:hypothetical protein